MSSWRRRSRPWSGRSWLPFLPSLLFGLIGAIWLLLDPPELEARVGVGAAVLIAAAVAGCLLLGSVLLERYLPSFRLGGRLLERALRSLELGLLSAVLLAAATAVGEELLFRGALMQYLGVWGQAILFGALHPISRGAWAYTVYTAVAGVIFGLAAQLTGTLWVPILAHFAVNLHGLLSVTRARN